MHDIVIHAITRLSAVGGALDCEPSIRPDLSGLTRTDLPVVILALMNRRLRSSMEIFDYLAKRNAPFEIEDMEAALDLHDGRDPSEKLWRFDGERYRPLISVI